MATYKKFENGGYKVQVESAIRDGEGKNIANNYAKQNGAYKPMTVGNLITDQLFRTNEKVKAIRTTGGDASLQSGTAYAYALLGNTVWSGNTPANASVNKLVSVGFNLYNNSGTDGELCPNGRALLHITSDTLFTINGGNAASLNLYASASSTTVVSTISSFESYTYNGVAQQTFSTEDLSEADFPDGVFVEIVAESGSDLSAMMINCLWSGYEVGASFVAYSENIITFPNNAVNLRSLTLDDGTIVRDWFGSVKETSSTYAFTRHVRSSTLSANTNPSNVGLSANTYTVSVDLTDSSAYKVTIGSEEISLTTADSDTFTGSTSAGVSVSFVVSTLVLTVGLASATLTDGGDSTYSGSIKANYIAYVSIGTSTNLGAFTFGEAMPKHGSSTYSKYQTAQMTTSISFTNGSGYMNIYSNRLYFAFDILTYSTVASAYADIVLTPNIYSECSAYSDGTTTYDWSFTAHDFGLEEWIYSGSAPYAVMEYVVDINRTVATLQKNYISNESFDSFAESLEETTGIKVTRNGYDEYLGHQTFSVVDTNETIVTLEGIYSYTPSTQTMTANDRNTIRSVSENMKITHMKIYQNEAKNLYVIFPITRMRNTQGWWVISGVFAYFGTNFSINLNYSTNTITLSTL